MKAYIGSGLSNMATGDSGGSLVVRSALKRDVQVERIECIGVEVS
jgi:hypothetical protein